MIDASAAAQSSPQGLLGLLRDEHQRLDLMLNQYRQYAGIGLDEHDRQRLVQRIDRHLQALMVIKETVLYPLVESRLSPMTMMALRSDHVIIRDRLLAMKKEAPDTLAMDLLMEELTVQVRDHINIETHRVFPHAQALDSPDLGQRGARHREHLLSHSPA